MAGDTYGYLLTENKLPNMITQGAGPPIVINSELGLDPGSARSSSWTVVHCGTVAEQPPKYGLRGPDWFRHARH